MFLSALRSVQGFPWKTAPCLRTHAVRCLPAGHPRSFSSARAFSTFRRCLSIRTPVCTRSISAMSCGLRMIRMYHGTHIPGSVSEKSICGLASDSGRGSDHSGLLSGRRRPIHSHGHPPPAEWWFVHKQCLDGDRGKMRLGRRSQLPEECAERLWDLGNGVMFTDGTAAHSCRSNAHVSCYR